MTRLFGLDNGSDQATRRGPWQMRQQYLVMVPDESQILSRLGPDGVELRQRLLRVCQGQPDRVVSKTPDGEREVAFPQADRLARAAVALDDLDLSRKIRKIKQADVRVRTCAATRARSGFFLILKAVTVGSEVPSQDLPGGPGRPGSPPDPR